MSHGDGDAGWASPGTVYKYIGRMLKLVMEQVIGNVRVFVEYWEEVVLVAMPDGKVSKMMKLPSNGKSA